MEFLKMHGLGNDFIVLDRRRDPWTPSSQEVRRLCDRHRGVGADGVILLLPPTDSDSAAVMRIFNRDGSDGEVCGNGLRCVGDLLLRNDDVVQTSVQIDDGRARITRIEARSGTPSMVEVLLPSPGRRLSDLPATIPGMSPDGDFVDRSPADLRFPGVPLPDDVRMTLVSVGCPHAVLMTEAADDTSLETVGPLVGEHAWFPMGINVHLVRKLAPGHLRMRTWERGAGPTLACGTGACAAAVADQWAGGMPGEDGLIRISMPGGDLWIGLDGSAEGRIRMRGPAVEVARGVLAPHWNTGFESETPS